MPPLPVIVDTFRVAFTWEAAGQHAVNVMHFFDSLGTQDADDLHTQILANADAGMWATVSNQAHMVDLAITPLDGTSATSEFAVPTSNADFAGQTASEYVPAVAVLVKLTTAVRGRSNRGRVFVPFTGEAVMGDGQVGSGPIGTMQTAWNNWIAGMAAVDFPQVVASYLHSNQHEVTNVIVEDIVGTQRRRQSRLR